MNISSSGYTRWNLTFRSGDGDSIPDVKLPYAGHVLRPETITFDFRHHHGEDRPVLSLIRLGEARRVKKDGTVGVQLFSAALTADQAEDDVLELARRVLDEERERLRAGYSSNPRLPGMDVRVEGLPGWPRP
jgi:hypothetical protein